MKIIVSRNSINNFSPALLQISAKNTPDSITNHLKIETQSDSQTGKQSMVVNATNYETHLIVRIPAQFDEEGVICVNSSKFLNLVREFYETDLSVEIDGQRNWVNMQCGDMETKLPGIESNFFPTLELEALENGFTISSDLLAKSLKRVIDCVPESSNLNYLKGVNLRYVGENTIEFSGSDSMRISRVTQQIGDLNTEEMSLIIPRKSAQEMINILEKEKGDCKVFFGNSVFQVHTENLSYQTQLLKDRYPDIKRIFDRTGNSWLRVNREKLLRFLRVLKVISENNQYSMKMIFRPNEVELIGEKRESEAQVKIECEFEGDIEYIGFNVNILLWGIQSFEESNERDLIFHLNSPEHACIMKADDLKNYGFLCMPMKISW